jgi:hypothetical protein
MRELVVRFFVGGSIVSLFAVFTDILKPSSFGGLFGAAPSVALATLALTILDQGKAYAAQEGRSMIAGSAALFVYCAVTIQLIMRFKMHARAASVSAVVIWLLCAVGSWLFVLR